jgi:hypothetical protein
MARDSNVIKMRINRRLSTDRYDAWECNCGTVTPVSKGSPKPVCEYCKRNKEVNVKETGRNIMETCEVCGEKCEVTAQMINIHTGEKKKICRNCVIKKMMVEGQHN